MQEHVPYLASLSSNGILYQNFDFDEPVPCKFNPLASCFYLKVCITNLPHIWSTYKGNIPSNINHKICIKCHNPNTSLYWKCEGHASHVPMQPTNKHLRISYVHEVNNSKTQLLSMSHTFMFHQMHSSISKYNTQCKITYGCSNMFLNHDWVTPSRILLLVINLSFPHLPHVSTPSVRTKLPHLTFAWMVKEKLLLGLRVYIGVLTCGKFFQTLFLPWDVCYIGNYGYFAPFIHILITFSVW